MCCSFLWTIHGQAQEHQTTEGSPGVWGLGLLYPDTEWPQAYWLSEPLELPLLFLFLPTPLGLCL